MRAQDVDLAAGNMKLTHASTHSYMDALRRRVPICSRVSPPMPHLHPGSAPAPTLLAGEVPGASPCLHQMLPRTRTRRCGTPWAAIGFLSNSAMAEPTAGGAGEGEAETGEHDPAWLFWTLDVHDRSLSSVMDRPFSVQDSDISVQVGWLPSTVAKPARTHGRTNGPSRSHLTTMATPRKRSGPKELHAATWSAMRSSSPACGTPATVPAPPSPTATCASGEVRCHPLPGISAFPPGNGPTSSTSSLVVPCCVSSGLEPLRKGTHARAVDPGFSLGNMADVERDAIASCTRLIDRLYTRSRSDASLSSTFLDAYDALSAIVMLVCLTRRRPSQVTALTQVLNFSNKARAIITGISGRFHGLPTFQELAIKLSLRVMEHGGSGPDRLPLAVPRRLRQSLHASFA